MPKNLFPYLPLVCSLLLAGACETDYVEARYPFKEVTTFSVEAEGTPLAAAISEGQILLYWPYTISRPATINPTITVSENATVSPASGVSVPLESGVVYTVTAQDGSTAVYTLQLVVNQPVTTLSEEQDEYVAFGGLLDIRGSNFIPDLVQNQVYLIDPSGTEIQVSVYAVSDNTGTGFGSNIQITLPEENATAIDTGWYKLKVKSGVRTITSSRAFVYVRYPYPDFDAITTAITVARGETFILSGKNFRQLGDARIWIEESSENYYAIELVSHTLTTATYRIPEDMPVREYYTILPGITNSVNGEFSYSYQLNQYPNIHPQLIVTD